MKSFKKDSIFYTYTLYIQTKKKSRKKSEHEVNNIHADVIPLRDEGVLSLLFFQCSLFRIYKKKKF